MKPPAPLSSRFTSGEIACGTHRSGSCVCPRTGLDALGYRNVLHLRRIDPRPSSSRAMESPIFARDTPRHHVWHDAYTVLCACARTVYSRPEHVLSLTLLLIQTKSSPDVCETFACENCWQGSTEQNSVTGNGIRISRHRKCVRQATSGALNSFSSWIQRWINVHPFIYRTLVLPVTLDMMS
jgi:hypothetical protein